MLVNPAYIRYLPWTLNTHSTWSLIFHFSHHSFITWNSISTSLLGSLLKGGSEISGALACTEATFPGGRILSVQGQTEVTGKFWNWRKTWQMRLCVCVCLWSEYEVLEVRDFWVKNITLLPHLFGNMIWSDSMLSSATLCTMYFLEMGHGTGGQMTKGVS